MRVKIKSDMWQTEDINKVKSSLSKSMYNMLFISAIGLICLNIQIVGLFKIIMTFYFGLSMVSSIIAIILYMKWSDEREKERLRIRKQEIIK